MNSIIDLHIHTNYSDGTDTCEEILQGVKRCGIKTFSITDHDIIEGNLTMKDILKNCKDENAPQFVSGVEVSSIYNGIELHLLGYGFDLNNAEINKMLAVAKENRKKKMRHMLAYLKDNFSIEFPKEDNDWLYGLNLAGKPHVAKLMIKYGYGKTVSELLKKYFDACKSPDLKTDAKYMIDCIHAGGGLVSLAHPIEVMREFSLKHFELDNLCGELKQNGLDAIEVFHSSQAADEIIKFERITKNHNLLKSGGSDYHGSLKEVVLGQLNADSTPVSANQITII